MQKGNLRSHVFFAQNCPMVFTRLFSAVTTQRLHMHTPLCFSGHWVLWHSNGFLLKHYVIIFHYLDGADPARQSLDLSATCQTSGFLQHHSSTSWNSKTGKIWRFPLPSTCISEPARDPHLRTSWISPVVAASGIILGRYDIPPGFGQYRSLLQNLALPNTPGFLVLITRGRDLGNSPSHFQPLWFSLGSSYLWNGHVTQP